MEVASRRSVLADEDTALAYVEDGMTIAIGGFNTASHPMALVRGIIRKGIRNLTIVGGTIAGLECDLLIGAGCVKRIITSSVTGEVLAGIGPFFRLFAERGQIDVWECDEGIVYAGLRAAGQGLPFLPWKAGIGTSLPVVNPELKVFRDPIKGEELLAVPAIKPDLCILHVQYSDPFGLAAHVGSGFGDRMLHRASPRTIVETEKIVPNEEMRKDPLKVSIPYANAVVYAPWGAHPFSSPGCYLVDEAHIMEYLSAANAARAGDEGPFQRYLAKYVYQAPTHIDYLETIGIRRLLSLREF